MSSFFKRLLLIPLLFLVVQLHGQSGGGLYISEVMADNESIIMDEDGDFSDWIEIGNSGSVDIDLDGWYLSDDFENHIKWLLPPVIIGPGEFLLVYASGKDRRSGELHTNFRLSALGEKLFIVESDGETIYAELEFPTQHPDVSYGYINNSLMYLDQPTPGSVNVAGNFLHQPSFSVGHGFFEAPFTVSINSPDQNTTIRFTLDGSAPGLANGTQYTGPLPVDSTTVLRAIATKAGQVSLISTSTYIFTRDVIAQPSDIKGYPTQWAPYSGLEGYAQADYEMDPDICFSPEYKDFIEPALKSIPSLSISTNASHLFSNNTDPNSGGIYIHTDPPTGGLGEDWERPVSAELILPDGGPGFQVNCGLRIHGGHSRVAEKSPKKSFRLVFDDEFGPDGLKYPLFENSKRDVFNTLILRAGFNQTWFHWDDNQRTNAQYINDSWAKDMYRKMGHRSAHNSFVHLYINGLYWGLYNLCERMDDEFMEQYFGGKRENYDVVKDYGELAEGTLSDWNQLLMQADRGFGSPEQYFSVQAKDQNGEDDPTAEAMLDIDNLIDYMILNFYMGNKDWDHHNWIAFRNRVDPESGFQFAPWDSERTFNGINDHVVEENNEDRPSYLYSQLRMNSHFRMRFADRANELLGSKGLLGPDSAKQVWMDRAAEIDLAIIAESARWGDYRRDVHQHKTGPYLLYTKDDHWLIEQQRLLEEYFPKRSSIVLNQLAEIGLYGDVVTDISEDGFSMHYSSFPNPFSSFTTIRLQTKSNSEVTLEVLDRNGKFIEELAPSSQIADMTEYSWHPVELESGLYFFRIKSPDKTVMGKVLLMK